MESSAGTVVRLFLSVDEVTPGVARALRRAGRRRDGERRPPYAAVYEVLPRIFEPGVPGTDPHYHTFRSVIATEDERFTFEIVCSLLIFLVPADG
jgi:hypothetical protein